MYSGTKETGDWEVSPASFTRRDRERRRKALHAHVHVETQIII